MTERTDRMPAITPALRRDDVVPTYPAARWLASAMSPPSIVLTARAGNPDGSLTDPAYLHTRLHALVLRGDHH
ncbi:hypothetical protein ACIRD2_14535 [Streptomyces sp. NPDC093595]|uniref:hypothetical protein n=1 Tax=Streptomyces sp. NPDC093595 TaxID=3366045 RepID=UPI00381B02A9